MPARPNLLLLMADQLAGRDVSDTMDGEGLLPFIEREGEGDRTVVGEYMGYMRNHLDLNDVERRRRA